MLAAMVYVYGGVAPEINLATPYRFEFTTNGIVTSGNSVRITYPPGYSSSQASCSVDGLSGAAPTTVVLHTKRTFVCQNLNKALQNEAILMTQILAPGFSGTQRGFMIEIMQGTSPVVLQRISFNGDIYIAPGTPRFYFYSYFALFFYSFTVTPNILFKSSYATYTFKILLANRVPSNGALFLNFTSDWILYSQNCSIRQGGVALPTSIHLKKKNY